MRTLPERIKRGNKKRVSIYAYAGDSTYDNTPDSPAPKKAKATVCLEDIQDCGKLNLDASSKNGSRRRLMIPPKFGISIGRSWLNLMISCLGFDLPF